MCTEKVPVVVFKCVFVQSPPPRLKQEGESVGRQAETRGDPFSVRTSHTGAEMSDAPLERQRGTERWRRREEKQRGEPGK